jgi:hypothetical protein
VCSLFPQSDDFCGRSSRFFTFLKGNPMKPLVALLAVALLVAAACSESALPTETRLGLQPRFEMVQGGCPNPFTLTSGMLDADGQAADRNGDGIACYLTENEIVVSWTDNNVPLSQIGGCPNGFVLVMWKSMDANNVDRNGDGLACSRTNGTGSTIVIDNNTHTQGM